MANTHSLDLESGSSQYAQIADGSQTGLDITGDFTFECWVKLESAPGANTRFLIVSKSDGNPNISYEWAYKDAAGTKQIEILISQDGSADRDIVKWDTTLATATWYHLAVTCDVSNAVATEFELYINGVSQGNGDVGVDNSLTAIYDSSAAFAVGVRNPGATPASFFDGLIDDVRAWSDIRTSAEIRANWYKELVGTETGLVGYWKLNNGYLDETSNDNDLTASGSPVFSTDVVNAFSDVAGSLDLELSSSQYAPIVDGDHTGLDITGDISMECWVKPETLPNPGVLMSKWNATTQASYYVATLTSGKIQVGISDDGTTDDPNTTKVITDDVVLSTGTWTHVAVTIDVSSGAAGVIIYINGVAVADTDQVDNATSIFDSSADFAIGCEYSSGTAANFFDGLVDDVRVWNDIRSGAEISANYNNEISAASAGLVGYWKLNNNYLDETSNNNDLGNGASPVFSTSVPFGVGNAVLFSNQF